MIRRAIAALSSIALLLLFEQAAAQTVLPAGGGCSLSGCTYTGPILLPNGSAAVPAVAFSGDAATGIYRVGASTIAVSVGGADRMDYNISYANGWAFGGNGGTQVLGGFKASASTSFGANADTAMSWQGAGIIAANNVGVFSWTSGATATSGTDTGLSRDSAGVIDVGTGAQGSTAGSLKFTTMTASGSIINTGITSDATHTDATICEDTTTHQFYFGSGAAGICLGTSSLRYKTDVASLDRGLADVMRTETISYHYRPGYGDPSRLLYGFAAEQMEQVMPELVGHDGDGLPNSVDWAGIVPVLVRAIQQQQLEIKQLRDRD